MLFVILVPCLLFVRCRVEPGSARHLQDQAGGRADRIQALIDFVEASFSQCGGAPQMHDPAFGADWPDLVAEGANVAGA